MPCRVADEGRVNSVSAAAPSVNQSAPAARPAPAADPRRGWRRAAVVWGLFGCASLVAVGALRLGTAAAPHAPAAVRVQQAAPAAALGSITPSTSAAGPRITPLDTPLDRRRWRSIVIHHSGSPAGDAAAIERQHFAAGLAGLGYHFVIGNGQGLEDGQVVVGYRWERQLPGAHVAASARVDSARWNQDSIGICLVGNGERRAFTARQLSEAAALVRALQAELGIHAGSVVLHSDLAPVASPGRSFPVEAFRAQLLP